MMNLLRQIFSPQNQFTSGGLLLMLIGGLGVSLRALPEYGWRWLLEQVTLQITISDEDPAFDWVKEWFLSQPFMSSVRRTDLDTSLRGEQSALLPAPGRHFFWYSGRPFWVGFFRSESTKGWVPRRVESFTFRTIGRDPSFLERFVREVAEHHETQNRKISNLHVYDDGWTRIRAYSPRTLSTVILGPGELEHLTQDVKAFLAAQQRYRALGVPYHRGYLLHGPPGTGKTSLVSALAAEFGMSIYAMNLAEFNDRSLKAAINEVPKRSVILFEDIDCMRTGDIRPPVGGPIDQGLRAGMPNTSDSPHSFGVTLSGLLNVLDGFGAPDSVLFVMTTNRAEVLDPALLRPGRIDYKLHMGRATEMQKIELYRRFFPQTSESFARQFVSANSSVNTMAEFQGVLLALGWNEQVAEQAVPHRSEQGLRQTAKPQKKVLTAAVGNSPE